MAINIYKIMSPAWINPIKVVSQTVGQPVRYGTPNFDQTYFNKQFLNWQTKSCYAQKWRNDDVTAFQVHVSDNAIMASLVLVDQFGRQYKDYTTTKQVVVFPDNKIVRDGQSFPLYTATFVVDFLGLAEGFYFLLLTCDYDTSGGAAPEETIHYLSEPQYINATQINTILLDASNDKNAFNTYFGSWAFRMRTEGSIHYDSTDSVDTQYNDEQFNLVTLNSYTFRKFKMYIGGVPGVPAWLIDKVNIFIGCKNLKIDSSFYTKDEGAKLSINQVDNRFYADLALRERSNYYDETIVEKSGIFIMTIPKTKVGVHTISLDSNKWNVYQVVDSNSIGSFMLYLNTTFKSAHNLKGTFDRDAAKVFYIPSDMESFVTGGSVVLTKSVNMVHSNIKPPGQYLDLNIEGSYFVVDWGDGSAPGGIGNGTSANLHLLHNYNITGQKTMTIYHDDSFILLSLSEPSLSAVNGDFGIAFKSISLLAGNLGAFDVGDIDKCSSTLLVITYNNCNITSLPNASWNYPNVQQIRLNNNKLDRGSTNAIVVFVDDMAKKYAGLQSGSHTLILNGQNPPAPIYTTGASAATHLRSYGWTVTTD